MDVIDYLSGEYTAAKVPDLVLHGSGEVKLVFILESPHAHELRAGYPVAGAAGRSALAFLMSQSVGAESLGEFVKKRHAANDPRVAILNVATVPLQEGAFVQASRTSPPIGDWNLLTAMRKSKAQSVDRTPKADANAAGSVLLGDLQERMDALPKDLDIAVVACGRFAQRFSRTLTGVPVGRLQPVRHPSYGWWQRSTGLQGERLREVRVLFEANI